jgi:hypothetical protein
MAAVTAYAPTVCPRCQTPNVNGSVFCNACNLYQRDDTMTVERCTYTRRFFGDYLLEGLLILVTLIVGWFIWLFFTAKTGQSPAKRLVNTYAINLETGRAIGAGETWLREVVIKMLAIGVLNAFTSSLAGLVDAVWVFFDKDRQALHDKMLKQVVVYAPQGLPESMLNVANAPRMYGTAVPAGGWQPPPAVAAPPDITEQLRELRRLRDDGILTEEEYEQKRADLASKL